MKKLGIYISSFADTAASSPYLTKGSFVYYELFIRELRIWCPSKEALIHKKPEEVIFLRSQDDVTNHVMSIYDAWTDYYMLYNDTTYRMKSIEFNVDYLVDCQVIDNLSFESIDGHETWNISGDDALRILYKSKAVKLDVKTSYSPRSKAIEKAKKVLTNYYTGITYCKNDVMATEALIKYMKKPKEEKKMTATDKFLKDLRGITITSTHSKMDACFNTPYNIYYPEMEITKETAETLFSVLLMMKRDFCHKVVFNPEKGTTTIQKYPVEDPITVRCKDAEFDYILGYEMARAKTYFGKDDYNWFNKIMNHRKTHIEYTEKKPTKKGGKK